MRVNGRALLGKYILEKDFQASVLELARLRGWRRHAERPARSEKGWSTAIQGDPGWPDLVLVRPPRLVIVELKTATGRLAPEQEHWLMLLRQCPGVEIYLWRPGDFGEIEELLA